MNDQNLKPFKKGNDDRRNYNGRPRKLPEIEKILADVLGSETNGETAMEAIIKALQKKANKGDVRCAELLLDRAYGRAKQDVNINVNERKTVDDLFPKDDEL